MEVTRCPTVYATGSRSQHGSPISDADKAALEAHDAYLNRKSIAASERMRAHMATLWQHSPRTRKLQQ